MNKRIKKKKMNLFLKRRGILYAMRIQDVSLFIPVPIDDLYRKYVEDRTYENKNTQYDGRINSVDLCKEEPT